MTPEEMVVRLLYRDGLMLVIDKPAGMAVHRGPKGGESLEDSFDALRFGLPRRPALAHRLDRDTSGCLVLGRHRKALARAGKLFAAGQVEKVYWAVVRGRPQEPEGASWLECRPRTGRTHQIRVHCAALGCPVLGDPVYGDAPRQGGVPLHLHARAVTLPLYPNRPPVGATA